MSLSFKYYYGKESEQFNFIKIPKLLFTEETFSGISNDAKILYALMLDRMSLSQQNEWFDDENRVFIIFTIEEAAEMMNCGNEKVIKLFKEIDDVNGIGLITRKRRGLGKPAIIYVKNFVIDTEQNTEQKSTHRNIRIQEDGKSDVLISEKPIYESPDIGSMYIGKSECNNTDINKTDFNNTDNQSYQSSLTPLNEKQSLHHNCKFIQTDMNEEYEEIIKENISYDVMLESYTDDCTMMPIVEEIKDLIVDVVSCRRCVYINKKPLPYEVSKSRFLKLTYEHVIQILSNIFSVNGKIKCMDSYLCTALYNITFSHNTSLLSGITANTGIVMI